MKNRPIYLDYAATTPVDPRVAAKMIPYLYENFGNPASRSHAYGWHAEEAVELAREQVAALIGLHAHGHGDPGLRRQSRRRGRGRARRDEALRLHRSGSGLPALGRPAR